MTEPQNHFYVRLPARVLGCLNNGEITIFVMGQGESWTTERLPVHWIPPDLRMPNSEFDILMKFPGGERLRILRKDEACLEIDE